MNHITSANDAVANGGKYHARWWAAAKQQVAIIDKSYATQETIVKPNVGTDIKIINFIQT